MKEINRILSIYNQIDHSQRKVALATVVNVEGSAYRQPGARMLVSDDSRWEGAISGDVWKRTPCARPVRSCW